MCSAEWRRVVYGVEQGIHGACVDPGREAGVPPLPSRAPSQGYQSWDWILRRFQGTTGWGPRGMALSSWRKQVVILRGLAG